MHTNKNGIIELKNKLAITAKGKEDVRRKLAIVAREKEDTRRKLEITAKQLAVTAKELAATAKEKEDVRRKLVVTAKALAVYTTGLEVKDIKRTAELVERVKELESLNKEMDTARAKERAILLSMGDGLFATDEKGNIIFINKKAEKLLGIQSEKVMGKAFSEIVQKEDEKGIPIPPEKRPINVALETGTVPVTPTVTAPYYYVRKNKTRFPVAITVTPIMLEKKIIGAIEVFRDITQEKATDRAKSEFISVASHQLKTPATAIKLLSERLLGGKMGKFTKKQQEYFEDIRSSNERMIELVNALLRVSRLELGAYVIRVQEKDPCAIVDDILTESKYMIAKKRLKLKLVSQKNHPMLSLDEHMFRMVINNLVTNAVNYTKEGGEIRVNCKVAKKGEVLGKKLLDKDYFVVTVADTGYGIPLAAQGKIFTKFFRADNARAKHTDGTGLGLYIVKSTLGYSGGQIWFTSRENKGSIFYVAIPMAGMKATTPKKESIG